MHIPAGSQCGKRARSWELGICSIIFLDISNCSCFLLLVWFGLVFFFGETCRFLGLKPASVECCVVPFKTPPPPLPSFIFIFILNFRGRSLIHLVQC